MDVLLAARRAYQTVNLAGWVNDNVLTSDRLLSGGIEDALSLSLRRAQAPVAPSSRVHAAIQSSQYAAGYGLAWARGALGLGLKLRRGIPLYLLRGPQATRAMLNRGSSLIRLYPVAELIVGRGHSPQPFPGAPFPLRAFPTHALVFLSAVHARMSRYGVLGLVLEAAPMQLADALERRGHRVGATACVVAATIGRSVLQPARLAVCAAALASELSFVLFIAGLNVAIDLYLRALRGGLDLAGKWTRRDFSQSMAFITEILDVIELNDPQRAREQLPPTEIPEGDRSVDPGGPGVHDRIQRRIHQLLLRFQRFQADEDEGGTERLEVAEAIAADLRRYCGNQPDVEALRGGLRTLKNFIDVTWGDENLPFCPPELGESHHD